MEYSNVVRDFVARTRVNLELIEQKAKAGEEAYEVTQLVNSLLGLLVFPQQRYFNQIPNIPMEELKAAGWPEIRVEGEFLPPRTLRDLMRYLRNAVAHFNIEFIPDGRGELWGLRVWNVNPAHEVSWRAEIPLEALRLIISKFLELILEEQKNTNEPTRGNPEPKL